MAPGQSSGTRAYDASVMTSTNQLTETLGRVVAGLAGGGEIREGQRAMAVAVAGALAGGRHLVVQAGTGTGKSLGYLVPAALSGKKVVVATATKALQDQLCEKDLPLLAATLGNKLSFAVVKGRSNYACRQALHELEAQASQPELIEPASASGSIGEEIRRLVGWAATTSSGDRAELDFEPSGRAWSSVSVTAEQCPGAFACPSGGECFAEAARLRAQSASVVVVNLHLYGAHLASGEAVLPPHDALIVDEAHELEDVLAASLGREMSPIRLRGLAGMVRAGLGDRPRRDGSRRRETSASVADGLVEVADRLERDLLALEGWRVPAEGLEGDPRAAKLAETIGLARTRLSSAERALRQASGSAGDRSLSGGAGSEQRPGSAGGSRAGESDAGQRALRALLATEAARADLERLDHLDRDTVAFVRGGSYPALEVVALDVSGLLSEKVFGQMPVVLTSATIPPGLGKRLGADPGQTDELDVGSPFPYQSQALLYCAAHLPDRRSDEASAAIHDELTALIEAAGGRTLALFTSRKAMVEAVAALRPRVPHRILSQDDLGKSALVSAFSGEEEACLFATMGFWQGLDVPGRSLSLVVIDRIPFPRPNDPLVAARRERAGPGAFAVIDLPRAATLLAQGAGRLIRSSEDWGVVAVLDPRLATASYRWTLVRALPPMRRTRDRSEVEAFLRSRSEKL